MPDESLRSGHVHIRLQIPPSGDAPSSFRHQALDFGKERGIDWYSPITSVVEYQPKTDSMMVYSATAGLGDVNAFRAGKAAGGTRTRRTTVRRSR